MPSTWSLKQRRLMEATTIYFAQCYEIIRQRTLGDPSSFKRLMAQRDDAIFDAKLCRREIAVLQRNRQKIPKHKRYHYASSDRLEILQIMWLEPTSVTV